ncbi:MAG: ABC transporter permease subunit, partial [Firmicutes bacterium]|nr:ABC transporter permease subunit [Bacillota bacterium]
FILSGTGMGIAGGLFIFIFRQFFRGLPKELEEAAYVDGAGFLRTFFTIVFPMAKPAFLTVGTLSFIWNYNDTHFPTLFNAGNNLYFSIRTQLLFVAQGGTSIVQNMISHARVAGRIAHETETLSTPVYDAAIRSVSTLVALLPLILLFLIIQKQFVQGVERSGIVG